jgi:cation-transporting ATPase 13A3/4/5
MLTVVLASAFSAIYILRMNQATIQQMTQYSTEALVLRDGEFVGMDSAELVPGDVIKIRGDWVLPCDLLLLQSSVVVDESGLTGESRPIRKSPLPEHNVTKYDTHAYAKHTLFAGTRTLQAGHGEQEVEALVIATGTATSKGELITHILFPRDMVFKYDEELPVAIGFLLVYGVFALIMNTVCLMLNDSVGPSFTHSLTH